MAEIEAVTGVRPEIKSKKSKKRPLGRWNNVCSYYLNLYSMCKELHCLPLAGGLEDQDWLVLHFFQVIVDSIGEYHRMEMAKVKK